MLRTATCGLVVVYTLLAGMTGQAAPAVSSISELKSLESKLHTVVEKVLPATVSLFSTTNGASGSGVIVSGDGLILTAGHVVQDLEEMTIVFPNGKQASGKVLGANYTRDIAMLQLLGPKPARGWPHADPGESKDLAPGDLVIAFGHAGGYDPVRTPPVRFGRVMATGPDQFFTTDCALIGGDSGGPLFDLDGRVIGIHSSIGESLAANNHAGIEGFRQDWEKLLRGETWGRLGGNSLTPSFARDVVRMPDPFAQLTLHEKKELLTQATGFYNAARPAIARTAQSTVRIGRGDNRLAYGTVVTVHGSSQPAILTKWSEVKNDRSQLLVRTANGEPLLASVSGVYPEHDLALLRVHTPGAILLPLKLTQPTRLELGSFLVLARPDGEVEGLGVVSVEPRSLRDGDKAFLGVQMDHSADTRAGVRIEDIVAESAADRAGLRPGDVIVSVDKNPVNGIMEMRSRLQRLRPGSKIVISYMRAKARRHATVRLGSLEENTTIQRVPPERMQIMQGMGAIPSEVRSNFPSVIQSDMPIHPSATGAPVTDLDGNLVGVAIARGSRIKTFIIPTDTIRKLLERPPLHPSDVVAQESPSGNHDPENRLRSPRSRALPIDDDPIDQVRRLLGEPREKVRGR